jgi:hypothetical protein
MKQKSSVLSLQSTAKENKNRLQASGYRLQQKIKTIKHSPQSTAKGYKNRLQTSGYSLQDKAKK